MAEISGTNPEGETLNGTPESDFVVGLDGPDTLNGGDSADTLFGSGGNDTLVGGPGNDVLLSGPGDDVFQFSFNLTQAQGASSTFTDWLSDKYGKEFGEHLPDAPRHHYKHDKHGNDDRHGHHGKNDQHDRHGNNDGHHSKHGDHDHHHKHGGGDDGYHAQDGGLAEKFFETNYKDWLRELVDTHNLGSDLNGDGKIKIHINEDSPNGTPRIEGLTQEQLVEIFGDRDSVILRDGHETEKAWYSNSFTSPGGQGAAVTSGDGFDTIADFDVDNVFGLGSDRIQFNFTADANWGDSFVVAGNPDATKAAQLAFLEGLFDISQVDAFSTTEPNDVNSTRISLNDNSWSTTLEATLLETPVVLAALDIYVNDILIG